MNYNLEKAAEAIHDLWVGWTKILLNEEPNISEERKQRWKKLHIPYAELSEEMKEIDRKHVKPIIEKAQINESSLID